VLPNVADIDAYTTTTTTVSSTSLLSTASTTATATTPVDEERDAFASVMSDILSIVDTLSPPLPVEAVRSLAVRLICLWFLS
jgi:hypothetical protein